MKTLTLSTKPQSATYTVGTKTYKTSRRVKMREVKIYRNGSWVYCDAFREGERQTHEEWARNFLHAMKMIDARRCTGQLNEMKEV